MINLNMSVRHILQVYLLSMMSISRLMMESLFSYAEIADPVNPL